MVRIFGEGDEVNGRSRSKYIQAQNLVLALPPLSMYHHIVMTAGISLLHR